MPFPNEHACEVQNSRNFVQTSIRRIRRRAGNGKMFSILIGRKPNSRTTETISFRYNKDVWSESEARGHCRRNDGNKFEPATNPPSRSVWERLDEKIEKTLAKHKRAEMRKRKGKQKPCC